MTRVTSVLTRYGAERYMEWRAIARHRALRGVRSVKPIQIKDDQEDMTLCGCGNLRPLCQDEWGCNK